jgi:hypothetical protein
MKKVGGVFRRRAQSGKGKRFTALEHFSTVLSQWGKQSFPKQAENAD